MFRTGKFTQHSDESRFDSSKNKILRNNRNFCLNFRKILHTNRLNIISFLLKKTTPQSAGGKNNLSYIKRKVESDWCLI